jgi:hypothetical protein
MAEGTRYSQLVDSATVNRQETAQLAAGVTANRQETTNLSELMKTMMEKLGNLSQTVDAISAHISVNSHNQHTHQNSVAQNTPSTDNNAGKSGKNQGEMSVWRIRPIRVGRIVAYLKLNRRVTMEAFKPRP